MNSMFLPSHLVASLTTMDLTGVTGWNQAFGKAEAEYGNSKGSMEAGAAPTSPRHQLKRRRLSRLLDRLTSQIQNNHPYVNPPLLPIGRPAKPKEDAPLDLSKKAQPQEPPAIKGKDIFPCNVCGQSFSGHDRLTKHIALRHRNRTPDVQRQYECEVCHQRFSRSDMLTRHARLHSGLKPYGCLVCGQTFSRSDHLATHRRTHTGEKPYCCPVCPYAACRRDMITRHMKTHSRKENLA